MKNKKIGVFDSGIGGLTVLNSLINYLPNEDFIYLGDTLNCPYGIKTPDQISYLVTDVTKYLIREDVKAIVIACNTATANSSHLHNITNIPIIGVIEPTAQAAIKNTNKSCLVLATDATIRSNIYQNLLKNSITNIYSLACPEFVRLVEDGKAGSEEAKKIVDTKLNDFKNLNIETVILGCTHFGLLEDEITNSMGNVKLIHSGDATAKELKHILEKLDLLNDTGKKGQIILNTTKDPNEMRKLIGWFKHDYIGINLVKL